MSTTVSSHAILESTVQTERVWLLLANLALTGLIVIFFLISPLFGYPLTYPEAFQVMQIVFPIFVGYLATAVAFIVRPVAEYPLSTSRLKILRILIRGPVIVFGLGLVIVWCVYGVSNSSFARPGTGMTVELFSNIHTALLSLVTATTGGLIAFLFPSSASDQQ